MTHHHPQFALIQTSTGPVVLAVDDISHAVPYDSSKDVHPVFAGKEQVVGVRVHFKAKGSEHMDLPGITALGLAEALNGAAF
jgi:hypothetical protein